MAPDEGQNRMSAGFQPNIPDGLAEPLNVFWRSNEPRHFPPESQQARQRNGSIETFTFFDEVAHLRGLPSMFLKEQEPGSKRNGAFFIFRLSQRRLR
jgi:hypothetical protein